MKTTLQDINNLIRDSGGIATLKWNGITLKGFIFSSDLKAIMQLVEKNDDRIFLSEQGHLRIR